MYSSKLVFDPLLVNVSTGQVHLDINWDEQMLQECFFLVSDLKSSADWDVFSVIVIMCAFRKRPAPATGARLSVRWVCYICLILLSWSAPSNACVIFTDAVSDEHPSRSALLRHDADLLQAQRDWSESSEDGHQSPDGCEHLLLLLHTDAIPAYYMITESHSLTNQPDTDF